MVNALYDTASEFYGIPCMDNKNTGYMKLAHASDLTYSRNWWVQKMFNIQIIAITEPKMTFRLPVSMTKPLYVEISVY